MISTFFDTDSLWDRALCPYPGAKNREIGKDLAARFQAVAGIDTYIEVFGGSYGVGRRLADCGLHRIYNDLNPYLAALMDIAKDESNHQHLLGYLYECDYSPEYFAEAKREFDKTGDRYRKAALGWFILTASRNGDCEHFKGISYRYTPLNYWSSIRKREVALQSVNEIRVIRVDALDWLERMAKSGVLNRPNILFYLDPPYILESSTTNRIYLKHWNMDTQKRFTDALKGRWKSKIAISNYQNTLYDTALTKSDGWHMVELGFVKKTMGLSYRGQKASEEMEVLYLNF